MLENNILKVHDIRDLTTMQTHYKFQEWDTGVLQLQSETINLDMQSQETTIIQLW